MTDTNRSESKGLSDLVYGILGVLVFPGIIAVLLLLGVGTRFMLGSMFVFGLWYFQVSGPIIFCYTVYCWLKPKADRKSKGDAQSGKSSAEEDSGMIVNVIFGIITAGFFAAAGWTVYQSGILVWRPEKLAEYAIIDGRLLLFAAIAWPLYFMTR